MRSNFSQKGFTLIELLVVISIIGVLSSVILANLQIARSKTRDGIRRQSLVQVRNALELYYSKYGEYPKTPMFPGWPAYTWFASESGSPGYATPYIPGLAPEFISVLPRDPLGGEADHSLSECVQSSQKRTFIYKSDGTKYKLVSDCAMENPIPANDPMRDQAVCVPFLGGPQSLCKPNAIMVCGGSNCATYN